ARERVLYRSGSTVRRSKYTATPLVPNRPNSQNSQNSQNRRASGRWARTRFYKNLRYIYPDHTTTAYPRSMRRSRLGAGDTPSEYGSVVYGEDAAKRMPRKLRHISSSVSSPQVTSRGFCITPLTIGWCASLLSKWHSTMMFWFDCATTGCWNK